MNLWRYLVAAALLVVAHSAYADIFSIQLSNKSARFIYSSEIFGGQYGPVDLEEGVYFNQNRDKMAHIGLMVRNDTLNNPLVISIGARAYYGDVGNATGQVHTKFAAIAVGGELLFIPDNFGGLGLGVNYFVAPSVVTYMDANGFEEYGVRLNYELTKQANVSLGYREIKTDVNNGASLTVDSSLYFGIALRF